MFAAIIIAGLAYTAMALAGIFAVPDNYGSWAEYINDLDNLSGVEAVPTFYAAKSMMGQTGLTVIGVTALAGVLTGIIGGYKATIRVLSTMAEDKILSEIFSKNIYSILFIMIFSITFALFGRNTLGWFVELTSFGAIVGFGYVSAAAYKLARAEGNKKTTVTGLIGAIISTVFVIVQLVPKLTAMEAMGSEAFLLLAFWCLLGFLFYWRTVTLSNLTEYSGMSVSGTVLFSLLVYSAFLWLSKLVGAKENVEEIRSVLAAGGTIMIIIIFIGLAIMLYVQSIVRKKHEAAERDKIRAMEGNLAKSHFLFNMSHDIRTPMNAIIGYTELALKEPASPQLHEYLTKIDRSNNDLLTLINDILEMSRIESGKIKLEFVPTNICRVFDGIRELFDEQMRQKKIKFNIYDAQVKDPYIWCDVKNLNRVLVNLLSNAYKFTPEGGTVSASVSETRQSENGYGSYEIRILDTGIGMSKEFVEKMFSPFERERTSTVSGIGGTGLGLSISKSIIDLMGGNVDVVTSPGCGTEIVLRLKFELAGEEDISFEKEEKTDPKISVDFTKKRLLLVEDNVINMKIAKTILTRAGFAVDTAENGKIAVDMIKGSDERYYDAVLMDIQMPVMDGYTAAREIRAPENKAHASIPILAMTANAFKEDEEAAVNARMQAHIAKPIDVSVLLKTLADVLSLQK